MFPNVLTLCLTILQYLNNVHKIDIIHQIIIILTILHYLNNVYRIHGTLSNFMTRSVVIF